MRPSLVILLLAALLLPLSGCAPGEAAEGRAERRSLPSPETIQQRGKLVAVTGFNPISYFLYRGEPMGYELELLQAYAEHLGVELEVLVEDDVDAMYDRLRSGEADLLAYRLVSSDLPEGTEDLLLTDALHVTRQVLIQLIPDSLQGREYTDVEPYLVQYPFELIGDTIHVPEATGYARRLDYLMEEIGGDIHIERVSTEIPIENLIRDVSEGRIQYTVASEDIALLNQAYYDNVAVNPALSVWQRVGWGVPQGADALLESVNAWLAAYKDSTGFQQTYRRYFEDRLGYKERVTSEDLVTASGNISSYDALLRGAVGELKTGWDWRLLAAQMFQESRFDPTARSWAGAQGLMQLMPATAREFGVSNANDPEDNIAGAVRFLNWLHDYWDEVITDPEERTKFVLASYNTGHGHVEDARRLTEKFGKNANAWEDVAFYLLQKSKPEFYQDPVVQYGYCRGLEPVTYVRRILQRFEHYRNFAGEAV